MDNFENPIFFNKDNAHTLSDYYTKKSKYGAGIPGYHGDIFQRGNGLWGDIFRASLPIVKYLGKQTANTLIRTGSDVISGENFIDSLKKQSKGTVKNIVDDIAEKASTTITGNGKHKQRKRKIINRRKTSKNKRRKLFI